MSTYVDHNRRAAGMSNGYMTGSEAMASHMAVAAGGGMHDSMGQMMNQFGALALPSGAGYMPTHGTLGAADANIVFANSYGQGYPFAQGPYDPMAMQYIGGGGYMTPHPAMLPFTPGRGNVAAAQVPRELPSLENRRGSYSTSATESTPATPFFGGGGDRTNLTRVASVDRSAYTTPSPQQALESAVIGQVSASKASIHDPDLEAVLLLDPAIPRAVPAVFTDHTKPLEQCLENRIPGNKNVYIRGLHPTTDDELLLKYASRFGDVEQSKAIIDTSTGACKGFGFAKFKDVRNSERCIKGFYRLGYEVGFARESFNARLKAEGDEASTNLYISNLPRDINETMLIQIFEPHHIVSSKILRDSMGNSRGVGFARFESRDVCEKVIKNFNGMKIGHEAQEMQVRYADTPAQKELKRITTERRQYRTNEYNIGAYGTHAVGMNPTMYQQGLYGMRRSGSGGPGTSYSTTSFRSGTSSGQNGHGLQGMGRGGLHPQSVTAPATVKSDDGSGDEGVTVVDSSPTANGTAHSSPSMKKEK